MGQFGLLKDPGCLASPGVLLRMVPGREAQAQIVQKVDSAIHLTNHQPLDSAIGFPNTYPMTIYLAPGTIHQINRYPVQWISIREINCIIHWIGIYPVDSIIPRSNNWALMDSTIHLLNNWGQFSKTKSKTCIYTPIFRPDF